MPTAPLLLARRLGATLALLGAVGCGDPDSAPAGEERLWLLPLDGAGEISAATSEADLIRRFGAAQVRRAEIELAEGDARPGVILFPDDPQRRLEVVWGDTTARARPELVRLTGDSSRWAVAAGITLGSSIADLERLNGGPFGYTWFGEGYAGTIASWRGGRLDPLASGPVRLHLLMGPPDLPAGNPEEWFDEERLLASTAAELRQADPRVREITLWFTSDGAESEVFPPAPEAAGAELDPAQVSGGGARHEDFVPAGWRMAARAEGDLDGDGRADAVLHLVPDDPEMEGITSAPEVHALLVLRAEDGGMLRRAGLARRLLVPAVPQYGLELQIRDGELVVTQSYGMSSVTNLTHRFRYVPDAGQFMLVEREQFSYTRPLARDDTRRVRDDYRRGVRVITTEHVRDGVVVDESTTREPITLQPVAFDHVDESGS